MGGYGLPVTPLKLFRIAAIAEACSWAGLLVGMFLKRVVEVSDVGVQIMGPIHGIAFVGYVLAALIVSSEAGWSKKQLVLGLFASIPPLMTIWFERWATKRDLLPAAWKRPARS